MEATINMRNLQHVFEVHMSFEDLDHDVRPKHHLLSHKHPFKACQYTFPLFERFISYFKFQVLTHRDELFSKYECPQVLIEMLRACIYDFCGGGWESRKVRC
jgi:hypothetical protein